jgi:hypothetical protein
MSIRKRTTLLISGIRLTYKFVIPDTKIDVFIWLLLNVSLNARGFLAERGIVNYEDARFPFYCEEIWTSNHLFNHCTISWNF